MATEAKRYIHVFGTTTQLTTANDMMYAGELWFDKTLGKFKIAPVDGNYNTQAFYTHPWADISGKPSTFPPSAHTHPQSEVDGLVSALAGKAATSHNHDANVLTTGTIDRARLGSGTTGGTAKFLREDSTWAIPAGGGGGGLSDPFGYVLDIRDYGAVVGSANGATNTAAIQQAIDEAAVQSGGWGSAKIMIPNTEIQYDTIYDLRTPLWLHGDNLMIQGGGKRSTVLRCAGGPWAVVAKHPRRWRVDKTSYVDTDTSGTVNTTGTVSGETQLINIGNYKPDLIEFRSSGTYPPGSGRSEFAPTISPSQYFALRSRGVIEARFPYHPFATGDISDYNSSTSWPDFDKVTWEFVHHNHSTSVVGGIAGAGGTGAPDPWFLWGDGTNYIFDLAMTDAGGVKRTWVRFKFAQVTTTGIHRVCIQFDPANSDSSKRLAAFVDGVRVTVTPENWIPYLAKGPYYPLNSNAPSTSDTTNLWTTWNRIGRWKDADFGLFTEQARIGAYSGELGANSGGSARTDYSILAVSVYRKLLYSVGTVGSAQTKVGGGAADDSKVWAMGLGNNSDNDALGWVCNTFDWSPNADTNLNVNCRGMGKSWLPVWGYICPHGSLWDAMQNLAIRGIASMRTDSASSSCGILLGPMLNIIELEDLDPARAGYFAAIGSMDTYVSYYLNLKSLKLGKMIHLQMITTDADTLHWLGITRCALRLSNSGFRLRNFSSPGVNSQIEAWCVDGADVILQDGTINNEEVHLGPWGSMFSMTRVADVGSNSLTLRNVNVGTFGGAFLRLDDHGGSYDPRKHTINIDAVKGFCANPVIEVVGPNWAGEFPTGPELYMTEQIAYEAPVNGASYCDLRSVDKSGYGVPFCGGFIHDSHEVRPKRVPEGGVSLWKAWAPDTPTTTLYQGSNSPPTWIPAVVTTSTRNPIAMSANILPGIHASCVLPWPNGTDTTTILHSGMTYAFSRLALATILTGAADPTRTHLALKWGYNSPFPTLQSEYPATFFELAPTTNSGKWASASARSKATNTNLTVAGITVPAWEVHVRRRWFGSVHIGGSSGPPAAFMFQTNTREPAAYAVTSSDTPTITSGNLILRRPNVAGWTTYATNKILDWLVGGTLGLDGPWFFGLSKTPVSPDDASGITEPSGGSYARVSVAMTGSNWGEWYDSGFFANKTAIEFLAPTGDWGDISHWFISDASSGGNIIAAGPLNRSIRVVNGSMRPTFYPGAFQVQL